VIAPAVVVVFDGMQIAASQPATLQTGTVVVPLDPYLRKLSGRIAIDPASGAITIFRDDESVAVALGNRTARVGGRAVQLPIAPYLRDGDPIIPLAAVARGLGLTVSYDGRARVVTIASTETPPLATMSPFVPQPGAVPFASPRIDTTPTPRPTVTGIPRPRRTPIEVHQREEGSAS
jgi:hypothetical protein